MYQIWDLHQDTFTEERNLILHKSRVRQILFSPFEGGDARWLISCGDRLAFWSLERVKWYDNDNDWMSVMEPWIRFLKIIFHVLQPVENIPKPSFMAERRRRKSGDSRPPSRLSLEISPGIKIGRQGKRELLQSFLFRGTFANQVVYDPSFTKFVVVDDTGIYYLLETLKIPMV